MSARLGTGPSDRTHHAPPATATNAAVAVTARMMRAGFIALLRRYLDGAGGGASEAIRPVHVLDIGLRQHVAARRHRAHHIGHREYRRVLRPPLERRAEPLVAEFRIRRLLGVFDPRQRASLA